MSTSAIPPIASSYPPISPKYALPDLPTGIPDSDPSRSPLDFFRLAVAKLLGEVWEEDQAKIYEGVDTGRV